MSNEPCENDTCIDKEELEGLHEQLAQANDNLTRYAMQDDLSKEWIVTVEADNAAIRKALTSLVKAIENMEGDVPDSAMHTVYAAEMEMARTVLASDAGKATLEYIGRLERCGDSVRIERKGPPALCPWRPDCKESGVDNCRSCARSLYIAQRAAGGDYVQAVERIVAQNGEINRLQKVVSAHVKACVVLTADKVRAEADRDEARKACECFKEGLLKVIKERDSLRSRFTRHIVCLCGSTRFYRAFRDFNKRLTLEGIIVLSIGCEYHSDEGLGITDGQKAGLDALHKCKIDLSHEVFILDVGGYIGSSTRSEIDYAEARGKPVRYLSKEFPGYAEPADPMDSLRSKLAEAQAGAARAREVLEMAVEVIRTWHSAGMPQAVEHLMWQTYWDESPDMKPIRELLDSTSAGREMVERVKGMETVVGAANRYHDAARASEEAVAKFDVRTGNEWPFELEKARMDTSDALCAAIDAYLKGARREEASNG